LAQRRAWIGGRIDEGEEEEAAGWCISNIVKREGLRMMRF
jgi:hypothetical protein